MTSVITKLRKLTPTRPLTFIEALRIAELQANRLLELQGVTAPPVSETVISSLPRVLVDRMYPMPRSGGSDWIDGRWVIVVNSAEIPERQRVGIFHEWKHCLDHPFIKYLYPPIDGMSSYDRAEQVAEYFAACSLMPRAWVKRDYGRGLQDARQLARRYGVSPAAMQRRLRELGLETAQRRRCAYSRTEAEVA
jgi:Zn-dependent peptidase ImmA (M78 family)